MEIIKPGNAAASPADIDKYVLTGGRPGEFVMQVSRPAAPEGLYVEVQLELKPPDS